MKNKKGQYGIDTVTQIAVALFILLLVIVAVIIGGFALLTKNVFPDTLNPATATDSNKWFNGTGWTLAQSTLSGFTTPTITSAINASSGLTIPASNYTLVGNIVYNTSAVNWNNATFTYYYKSLGASSGYNQATGMVTNLTNASAGFFGSSSTFFGILVVVVIMIFLGLMIGAVMLFKNRNGSAVGK
jgi:hypothetical protein